MITPLMTKNDFHPTTTQGASGKKKFFSRGSTPRNKIFDDICITSESKRIKKVEK